MYFAKLLGKYFPDIGFKLKQAGIKMDKDKYISKVLLNSFLISIVVTFYFYFFIKGSLDIFIVVPFVFVFVMFVLYLMKYPDAKINVKKRQVNRELVFGIRFFIIEIESGVPIYEALVSLKNNYPHLSSYINNILNKVDLGTNMEVAIKDEVDLVPSENFRRVLWQIYNSIHSGSDLAESLNIVLDQIVEEEKIAIIEYGRKLNPLSMMFLMLAIVLPSIGAAMVIVIAVFVGFKVSLPLLLVLLFLLAFVQYMFIQMIKISRPAVDL